MDSSIAFVILACVISTFATSVVSAKTESGIIRMTIPKIAVNDHSFFKRFIYFHLLLKCNIFLPII